MNALDIIGNNRLDAFKFLLMSYLFMLSEGRQQQQGRQQQGPTRGFKESGLTFLISSASPPQ